MSGTEGCSTELSECCRTVSYTHLDVYKRQDKAIFMKDGQIVLMGDVEEIRQERGESVVDLYRQIYG